MTTQQQSPSPAVRRRLVPPLVAVIVLAVLLGGAYSVRRGTTKAPTGGDAPAVLRLADYRVPMAGPSASGLFRLAAHLPALPAGPAEAAVRWLTPPNGASAERLAKVLGLRGDVAHAGGATTYTAGAATLRVQQGAGGQWQFVRSMFLPGTTPCPYIPTRPPTTGEPRITATCDVAVPVPPTGVTTSTGSAGSSGGVVRELGVTTPAAARAAARPVLEAVGIDPADAVVQATRPVGSVVVDPNVGGLPTHGLTTTVWVTGDRISSASGWLGGSRAGATYPVISATAAWHQLLRTPLVRPLMACPEHLSAGNDPMTCGGSITVTGARFGLSVHEQGGRPLLVPSWLFDVQGSANTLAVVAVDPRYLAAPPLVTPSAEPGSGGSGSVGSGSVGSGSVGSGSGGSGSGGSGSVGSGSVGGSTGTAGPPVAPSSRPGLPGSGVPPKSRFSSVTSDGAGLVVQFAGGVPACFSYAVVPVETQRRVSLSLVERTISGDKPCIDLAQVYERRVALAQPLGTRTVVDAVTGFVLLGPAR